MDNSSFQFLQNILGLDGAKALRKASEPEPALESLLVPRAALAWVMKKSEYEGNIPGISNSYIKFQKAERYQGVISLPECNYEFEEATPEFVAAAISVVAGMTQIKSEIKDGLLKKLGKSIDTLVEAQDEARNLLKADPIGQAAQPIPQGAPQAPVAPSIKQLKPKLPKAPKKMPALKVEKSEATVECSACGKHNFEGNKFKGCLCWKDLAKNITTTSYGNGYVLEFKDNFDIDTFYALKKSLKGD